MVTRFVNNNGAGDLGGPGDSYGIENDLIVVQVTGSDIKTYTGNDRVDATRSTGAQSAYLGYGDDEYYGGLTGADSVWDGDGNDFVELFGGDDNLQAGAGNDTYRGGDGTDRLQFYYESYNGYGSTVASFGAGITIDLAKTTAQNLGRFGIDTISGFEDLEGTWGSDTIYGTNGDNDIYALDGNDVVDGRGGDDTIDGFLGRDTIIGGLGSDDMNCGAGDGARDTLKFLKLAESTVADPDEIFQFDRNAGATGDRIDLRAIDANPFLAGNQNFVFRGAGAFRANVLGEVRIVDTGADIRIEIDADRDNGVEMAIIVRNVATLAAFDFIL
jgi:Ca2+-binding RTX toxin-like protein